MGTEAAGAGLNEAGIGCGRVTSIATACAAVADAARAVQFHAETCAIGERLAATAARLVRCAAGELVAEMPQQQLFDWAASDDELDTIVLSPGHGWRGSGGGAAGNSTAEALARPEQVSTTFGTPPQEHPSLAVDLHLPSSLHLGPTSGTGTTSLHLPNSLHLGQRSTVLGSGRDSSDGGRLPAGVAELELASHPEEQVQIVGALDAAARQPSLGSPLMRAGRGAEGSPARAEPRLSGAGGTGTEGEQRQASASSDAAADPYVKEAVERAALLAAERRSGQAGGSVFE